MKDSFLIYREWSELINCLPDDKRLKFYDLLFEFDGSIPDCEGDNHLKSVVNFVFRKILENNSKWVEKSEKAKEAARLRWDKFNGNKSESMRTHANAENALHNVNDNVNVPVNVNDKKKEDNNIYMPEKKIKSKTFKSWVENDLIEAIRPFAEKYGTKMCNEFFRHWKEPLPSGKMRMTAEKAWDTKKRLITWSNNNFGGGKSVNKQQSTDYVPRSMRGI